MTLPSPQHFTDREEALAAYDELWASEAGPRILNIEGLSGNGKTTLLWYLDHHHPRPPERLHLRLDMAQESLRTGDYELLDALARQLRPHLSPAALEGYMRRRSEAQAEATAIRQSALHVQIEQRAEQGSAITGSPNSVTAELNRRLGDLRRQTRADLAWLLAEGAIGLADRPVALFVDTYELVRQASDVEFCAWFEDQILPSLMETLPRLRVVLAGREDLPYRADRHRRSPLRLWTRAESDYFLASYGLTDVALAQAIYAHCAGHPLLTDLARELWQMGKDTGQPLSPAELQSGIDQAAAAQWLFGRLLDRLPPELRDALRAAALLRELSLEAINALLGETPLAYADYQRLLRFSFVQTLGGRPPRVHDLIRQTEEAWIRSQQPARHRRLHARAQAYYTTLGKRGFVDALYHRLALEPEDAFAAWDQAMAERLFAFDRAGQQTLLEVARLPERWAALSTQQGAQWHWRRGQTEYYSDLWLAACNDYEEALGLFRAVGDRLGEANVLQAQGDVLAFLDQRAEALAKYEEALGLFRAVGARLGEANVLKAQGDVLAFLAQRAEALAKYEEALGLFRAVGDRLGEANVLQAQGDVLAFLAQRAEALAKYEEALGLFRAVGARLGEANVLRAQGDVLYFLKQTAEALAKYEEALGLFRAVGDRLGEANVLRAQGDVLAFLAQRAEALAKYEEALGLFRAVGDRLGEANVLQAQGDVLRSQGQYDAAHDRYQAALMLYRDTGARQGQANVYLGLGRLALAQEQPKAARSWTEQAIALHAANQSRYDVALDCETLAKACEAAGDAEGAASAWRRAVDNYCEINLIDRAASALTSLGDTLDNAGRRRDALPVYAEAVALLPDRAWLRRNYADSLIKLGQLDEAASQLDAAEAIESDAPYLALRRAELAKARQDPAAAQHWASEALRRQPEWDEAQAILAWAQSEPPSGT